MPIFLFGDKLQKGLVYTVDEHDKKSPVKAYPDRPHLRMFADLWGIEDRIAVAKSRQMLISWGGCSHIMWESLHPGQRWLTSCKKFDDANNLLLRMYHIWDKIPLPVGIKPKMEKKEGVLTIHHEEAKSFIHASAQDTDAARSHTFSGVWIDEAGFTDYLDSMLAAVTPTTMAGGKLFLSSTPNGQDRFHNILVDGGRLDIAEAVALLKPAA